MEWKTKLQSILIAAVILAIAVGCHTQERYTYSRTKADYPSSFPDPRERSPRDAQAKPPLPIPAPLNLDAAIHTALANSPDVTMAVARIRQSETMIQEAEAAFWPMITAYGEYVQGDAPSAYLFKTIDQRRLPGGVDFNAPGWFENYEVGVQGRINLFSGGRDYLRKRMAETGLAIQDLDRQNIENALVSSVINAFFSALAAADFVSVAKESVETVTAQLRTMEARYRAGGTLKSDVLSLEVRLAQAREELIRAESNRSLTEASLATLLGYDPDSPLELTPGQTMEMKVPSAYATALPEALANRPELKEVRNRLVQSRMALDAARAEYLPRLDAQGRYYLDNPNWDFNTDRENWTFGLMLNWDLFSGFSRKARVDKAQWILREMLAADRKTTQSIQLDVKRACLELVQAEARTQVTGASVAQAEEALRIVKKEYEGGSATVTRYLDAELARNRARILSLSARYDREKALGGVGRALGRWANRTTAKE